MQLEMGLKNVWKQGRDEKPRRLFLLQKCHVKERLEHYSTAVIKVKSGNRSRYSLPVFLYHDFSAAG